MIVDPQIDFISGSLKVEGAKEKMDALADRTDGEYICKLITMDQHPYRHCSFYENGGQWPMHCVVNTIGAAVYQPIMDAVYNTQGEVKMFRKGEKKNFEEYSIFKNLCSARHIDFLLYRLDIEVVDVCGIAGDVCVLNTLKDGIAIYGRSPQFNVLEEYCPSIDGGTALREFLES